MSTTLLSAMTAALLSAACLTALADPPKKQNAGESTAFQASTVSAPVAEDNDAADGVSGYIQPVGRSGSHSMHPNSPVAGEPFADDEEEVARQTADQ